MDEPLRHNKAAFVTARLGAPELNRLKTLASHLNHHRDDGAEAISPVRDSRAAALGNRQVV